MLAVVAAAPHGFLAAAAALRRLATSARPRPTMRDVAAYYDSRLTSVMERPPQVVIRSRDAALLAAMRDVVGGDLGTVSEGAWRITRPQHYVRLLQLMEPRCRDKRAITALLLRRHAEQQQQG